MNITDSFIFKTCEWITRFAYVNLLWICFSFLGLLFVGFFPATIAMFTIVRKWILGQTDIPIFKTFYTTFKNELFKSNVLGAILLVIGFVIYFEYTIIEIGDQPLLQFSKYPLFLSLILFCLLLFYVFPMYVHFDISVFQVFKNSFLTMLVNPFYNIVMVLCFTLSYFLVMIFPVLLLFFSGSVSSFVLMWCCYQSFKNIQRRKEKANYISEES